jgi:glutamate-1-semialdehyde 2,1-aminomutase
MLLMVQAVVKAKLGTSFGMPTELETQIAALAVSMVPNVDKIRFVNSGTGGLYECGKTSSWICKKDKIIKLLVVIMVILTRFRQEVEQ